MNLKIKNKNNKEFILTNEYNNWAKIAYLKDPISSFDEMYFFLKDEIFALKREPVGIPLTTKYYLCLFNKDKELIAKSNNYIVEPLNSLRAFLLKNFFIVFYLNHKQYTLKSYFPRNYLLSDENGNIIVSFKYKLWNFGLDPKEIFINTELDVKEKNTQILILFSFVLIKYKVLKDYSYFLFSGFVFGFFTLIYVLSEILSYLGINLPQINTPFDFLR